MSTKAADSAGVSATDQPLLDIRGLSVSYHRRGKGTPAIRDVCLDIRPGETVALVGESGSGKSTLGRAVLGLTAVTQGTIRFDGEDITHAAGARRRELSKSVQAVFQDPNGSLNPALTVGQTLAEPLLVHSRDERSVVQQRVREVLELVGLPAEAADRYPRQFSGGQRQRIAIARALVMAPKLIVCDEPVSALDLSVQAQVLNLFTGLQRETGVSYLFISHDLAVVRHLAQRIVVLYRGDVVEHGTTDEVYADAQHPYTRKLLAAAGVQTAAPATP
ncbi:ABC transporter ATP-binding protein [Streptomyces sp. MBT62]|uniref:ABC transporter ATP-binding protein n=1 Tax=Streptomyces sp. MBT62 TaxID=2800410 RepID=UPI0019099F88|nr:ATP-binding cassette domain-containing protein [Streptomyces sp. MBT62]MBK3564980.1 ABC transporter ATP-binding protein [Streptomyces sp. MBT62]